VKSTDRAANFADRHIGPDAGDIADMLAAIGCPSIDALVDEALPASIRLSAPLALAPASSEAEALSALRELEQANQVYTSLIGQGYHGTVLPAVIERNILENPAWYTAYTPYQPEISQGRLEALVNFQTAMADLAGLDLANASLLDEATAAAEAMAMARRATRVASTTFFADAHCHPQTLAVLRTRAEPMGWTIVTGDPQSDLDPSAVFGALLQYPDTTGRIRDLGPILAALAAAGAVGCVAADPLALALLAPPGELGADIVLGSSQRLGVPMGFGGPHAAYIACRERLVRALPGRLVGVSVDARGRTAYRLALQTREQHIRRDKATSNICTAQVLPAVIASMYAVYHGAEGLRAMASQIHRRTAALAAGLRQIGVPPVNASFFDTLTVDAGDGARQILARARAAGINLRDFGDGRIGVALDETSTDATVETLWRAFGGNLDYAAVEPDAPEGLPTNLARRSEFMTHPVFNRHRSETELMRYMRRLADRDLGLDRTMIPLGSCTMKLNAAAAMLPVSWRGFAELHPFAPADQAKGYARLIDGLEKMLCEITGFEAVSLQPNSGAQGEFAGLMAIRRYHASRNQARRDLCLIPASAHGTNPASAHMAGLEVKVVATDAGGNIDIADLEAKAAANADRLAAIMVTYPSTHGVFEEDIRRVCDIVHANGGQVYLDGANLNAQVGLARPGDYGADVSHLNLHKTFAIPHGGGGPGVGPIGVKSHLAPFLPTDPRTGEAGAVTAAPFGSAGVLPISYAYILMMGAQGLKRASQIALLSANYLAGRLEEHFPVLYRNRRGRVAHECIIDPRPLKETTGVTVDDIAKRLIDFGFHAPTMSFPVPGTLMIEPTESEPRRELDRFVAAMVAIRAEIAEIESGAVEVERSVLRGAPHTLADLTAPDWDRPYTRADAIATEPSDADKYLPPVNRVDNAYGDRNLVCTCPPLEPFREAAE